MNSQDGHHHKIADQRTLLLGLAGKWRKEGLIDDLKRDDMVAIVTRATFADWQPLIFVMPYAPLKGRVEEVDRDRRAGHASEYIIEDLVPGEFEIIEFPKI